MTKRVRGGKEDEYRWFKGLDQPNSEQYGTIGGSTTTPLVSVGGLIVINANIEVDAIAAGANFEANLMFFYEAIRVSSINAFFLPLGCTVIWGEPTTSPGPAGGVPVVFSLNAGSASPGTRTIWQSIPITLTPVAYISAYSSVNHTHGDATFFSPVPIGVNSVNVAAGEPFTRLLLEIHNNHMSNPSTPGSLRAIVWGIEG